MVGTHGWLSLGWREFLDDSGGCWVGWERSALEEKQSVKLLIFFFLAGCWLLEMRTNFAGGLFAHRLAGVVEASEVVGKVSDVDE